MTHTLSEITIKNFKSIKSETFELSPFTPLVGYNNAGKSNILESIKWLLRKTGLAESAFNNKGQEVEISGRISGITEGILSQLAGNQRTAVEPFLSANSIYIKRIQATPLTSTAQIKLLVQDPENIGTADEWKANPTGLDQALQALFPEPIHIGAMEDCNEDVSKSKNTSTIGKLLSEIIGPIQTTYASDIETAMDGIKQLFDSGGANRATELIDFDTEVNKKIESFFPGVNVKVHIPTPELKEVFAKGTIKVFEDVNPEGKDVSSLGHGALRSIQMALVRHLADIKKVTGSISSNTLLLIDEPELYLHPQAIEVLRDALELVSSQGYQVVFSTHSPFMITSKDVTNTILVRKNDIRGTYKRNSLRAAIPIVVVTAPSQLELIFSLSRSSDILFSERVILAEGTTENRLLPSIIEKVTSKTIGLHKTALVSMGGSGNTRKAKLVLETMDIPTKAIVDLDYALKEGEKEGFLTSGDTDVASIKAHLASIAVTHSINLNDGWPTNKMSAISAADTFRLLAKETAIQSNVEAVKTKMKAAGIYVWKKGTIEDHLGGVSKNEASWANFNARLETEELMAILPNDYAEITELVNWAIS